MNYWFTADLHFNHPGIIRVCKRPFDITEQGLVDMNEALIAAWNSRVKKRDIVYHLGDFVWKGDPRMFEARLNGAKVFIRGNHDGMSFHNKLPNVHDVKLIKTLADPKPQKIWLSHYAHRSWPDSRHGSWHLYGHDHGSLPDDEHALSMDVGVDTRRDLAPYSLDEVRAHMARKVIKPLNEDT